MRRWLMGLLVLLAGTVAVGAAEQAAPSYSASSVLQSDFGFLRDPRALERGFVRAEGGRLVWGDGTRARFWGVNISNRYLWIDRPQIDRVVDVLARSGTTLVRFEAIDSRGGILAIAGEPGTRRLDPVKLDTLHYWIYRLRSRGITYYLNLLDFREFTDADGVPNAGALGRAAKPYAMFDKRLIELQKEYATQLLTTRNPLTGLAPVEDPALVLVELCNEHGFFLNHAALETLAQPYRSDLERTWNAWLVRRYGSREALARAWGSWRGRPVLEGVESPGDGTVRLPLLRSASSGDVRFAPSRLRDGVEFYYEVQRGYMRVMREHLRLLGLRVPITAVVSNDIAADLASVAAELDFLSENHYNDHPRFSGQDWQGRYHYANRNPLRDASSMGFAPLTSALRFGGKPVVVREWGTVWPNRFRASSVVEAAAYARLQDYDVMLLFGYKTGEDAERLVEFGYQADPAVWGLYALGATVFLRGDVRPAEASAVLEHTSDSLFRGAGGATDLLRLAYALRVNTVVRGADTLGRAARTTADAGDAMVLSLLQPTTADSVLTRLRAGRGVALRNGVYTSGTGEIVRDVPNGRISVDTPLTAAVAGELPSSPVTAGTLQVESASPVGAVMAVSLDGQPLSTSRRYLVKMVTVAENTGQDLVPATPGSVADFVLMERGRAPVLTLGTPSERPTRVWLNGRLLATVGMTNGTWEILVDGDQQWFWSDTPGIRVTAGGRSFPTGQAPLRVR